MKDLVGRFVISRAGHDKDKIYVVIQVDEKYLYLSDGKNHTMEHLKKKSPKHVILCNAYVEKKLLVNIQEKSKIFDHEIKYAIKMQEKGKEEGYVKE